MTTLVSESERIEEEGSHVLAVLDSSGDTRIVWDPEDDASVGIARQSFEAAQAKGYQAFRVDSRGRKTSEVVRQFDPEAEKLIMAPALQGG